jgi:hypothetical protein
MIPEPIEFTIDDDGSHHFARECLPFKTVIDIHALPFRSWLKIDESRARVTMMLDGRTVVYERTATGLHGEWICVLRIGQVEEDAD